MLGESHSLIRDFAEYKDDIYELLQEDLHFRSLSDQYHDIDQKIRVLEEKGQPVEDHTIQVMKSTRTRLKDELFDKIKAHHR